MPAPAPRAPAPAHVEAVTRTYRAAFAKERSQVMSEAATKDQIARIRDADRDAQAALGRLRATHGQAQAVALTQARAAVARLEAVLAEEEP